MADIECLRVGTRVKLAEGITGLITEISIKQTRTILYLVAWWNGRDQKSDWFQPWQVEATECGNDKYQTIGFQHQQ